MKRNKASGLGFCPRASGRELSRLQRCNQERLFAAVHKQSLTWREIRKVVAALLISPKWEHETILRDPRGTVLRPKDDIFISPADEQGLCLQAKQLLRRLIALEQTCLEMALLFSSTELGQFEAHEEQRVRSGCARALVSLGHTQEALREACGQRRTSALIRVHYGHLYP